MLWMPFYRDSLKKDVAYYDGYYATISDGVKKATSKKFLLLFQFCMSDQFTAENNIVFQSH